jgi:hypothetical protein
MDQNVYKTPELSVDPEPRSCGRPFAEINAINADFWAKQAARQERQLTDENLTEEAYSDLREQAELGVPFRQQRSYGALLDKAERRYMAHRERLLQEVRRENGRQGGKARKPDPLQAVIQKIVERNPTIDCPTLLELLQNKRGIGVIQDVDGEDIYFTDANNQSKSTKVTSLKDRLHRAKKKIESQKAVSASQS